MLGNFLSKTFVILLILIIGFALHISKTDNLKTDVANTSESINPIDLSIVQTIYPDSTKIVSPKNKNFFSNIYDKKSKLLGHAFSTSPFSDNITGYAGPTPLLVITDPKMVIKKIILMDNGESPGFVKSLENKKFFNSWNDLKLSSITDQKIDTITGATMTSNAVVQSLNKRVKLLLNQKYVEKQQKLISPKNIIIFIFIILSLLSFFKPAKFNKYRIILQILSITIIGFYSGLFISATQLSGYVTNGVTLTTMPLILLMLCLAFLLPLFTNKSYYCHFVCPYGACQELAGKIIKNKPIIPKSINRVLKHTRMIFFGFIIILLFFYSGTLNLTDFEPFSVFLFSSATKTAILLAVVFIFLSIFINRPWCRFFCPTGYFIELFRKSPKKKVKESSKMNFEKMLNLLLCLILILVLAKPHVNNSVLSLSKESGKSCIDIIHSRKSVRSFSDKDVSKTQIENILKAGMAAPTAADRRPWNFIVIRDKQMLKNFSDSLKYGKMIQNAQAAILVCGVKERFLDGDSADFWIQDCSAASQNILLAVESMGLGSVWVGLYPKMDRVKEFQKMLKLDDGIIPINVIPIGYPKGNPKPKNKFNATDIHWYKW